MDRKDKAYLDSLRLDMIDNGDFKSEYKTLWQSLPSSFFKMKVNPKVSADGSSNSGSQDHENDSSGSYEFLKNPSGYELNKSQKDFISKYFDDYKTTDPYIILEWLYDKALLYEQEESNRKLSKYAQ